ncbi:MAG: glycosyltransferase family 1 protein [Caulobacteraceae bacterium]|nr:glycosyltransferase family 1 protein [Caulobacteraceae bacterium]
MARVWRLSMPSSADRPTVLFDATRLAWRARRASPTGIDRVLLAYARWLGASEHLKLQPVALAGSRVVDLPVERFEAMLDRLEHPPAAPGHGPRLEAALASGASGVRWSAHAQSPADWGPLGRDLAARWLRGRLKSPPHGRLYLNVTHTGLHRPALLAGLAEAGVAPVLLAHDLIPITHPEYCAPGAEARHKARIDAMLRHGALIIANSQATADDLSAYAAKSGVAAPPIVVSLLGIEPGLLKAEAPPAMPHPYFLCVGTLEARKNLAFLLSVWRRLFELQGDAAPRLVLVGRRGWENETVIDHLDRSPARALVHEVADLTDAELGRLMRGATALLAPSNAEGFDLPLIEALSLGTPAIASDIPVHRQLASGARLIDPLDGPAWTAAILDACHQSGRGPAFSPPSWSDHFSTVGDALGPLLHG